jgi:transposase-like protein
MMSVLVSVVLAATPTETLTSALQARVARERGATVAVVYQRLGAPRDTVTLAPDRVFHAASTMKVAVLLEVFRQVDAGTLSLDAAPVLTNGFTSIVDGSPFTVDARNDEDPGLHERVGQPVPVRELVERMITRSSNLATNAVIARVDAKRVTKTLWDWPAFVDIPRKSATREVVSMERRKRRSFNEEFKAEAVRLVREGGKSVPQVARDLDLTDSALRNWVRQAEVDEGKGPAGALTTAEREEFARLRKEVRQLTMERDFLKKAAAFFAKEGST